MKDDDLTPLVRDLRADLRSAIELRDQSLSRRFDQDFVDMGGQIFYAIDASVINHVYQPAAPAKRAPASPSEGSAVDYQIFSGPRHPQNLRPSLRDLQFRLAKVIPTFLVEGRVDHDDVASSLLLLPGHTTEVRKLYDAIVGDLQKEAPLYAKVEQHLDLLRRAVKDAYDYDRPPEDEHRAIIAALSESLAALREPHRRFGRMNRIIRARRILGLQAASVLPEFADLFHADGRPHRSSWEIGRDPAEPAGAQGSASWWDSELTGRLPPQYKEIDRLALATLDRLNKQLQPDRARVVLFTSNKAIIEAGKSYRPWKGREDQFSTLTFSDLYLRHPSSLVVDSAFVLPHGVEDSGGRRPDPNGWIDTLLAATLEMQMTAPEPAQTTAASIDRWIKYRAVIPELRTKSGSDKRLIEAIRKNRALHFRFVDRWAGHLAHLLDDHVLNAESAEQLLQDAFRSDAALQPEDVESLVKQARDYVKEQSERSWSEFFNTAADTGLELIGLTPEQIAINVWPIPPLYVRGNNDLKELLAGFWHPDQVRKNPDAMLRRLKAASGASLPENGNLDLRESQTPPSLQSTYVYALCYGLLFAYAGRWSLTRLLAQRAIQIARGLAGDPDGPEAGDGVFVTGREAYYLLAVCVRVSARTAEQYAEARQALHNARMSPRDPAESPEVDEPLSGLRMDTEEIAIDAGEMVAELKVESARVALLRDKIEIALARSTLCKAARIRTQQCIALRSEYFLTWSIETFAGEAKPTGLEAVERRLAELVDCQVSELETFYGSLEGVPLRDRTLLRLGAASAGKLAGLPASLQAPSVSDGAPSEGGSLSSLDRRRLMRLERLVI